MSLSPSEIVIDVLFAKIHRATVTHADLNYNGSLSIDADLLDASGILPHQKIDVYNLQNGERLSTYAIPAPAGSGMIQANGAAAHQIQPGHLVIIAAYASIPLYAAEDWHPRVVMVDSQNKPISQVSPMAMGVPLG